MAEPQTQGGAAGGQGRADGGHGGQGGEDNGNNNHEHAYDFNGFCNICKKSIGKTGNPNTVISHQNSTHRGAKEVCSVCGRRFSNMADLADHMQRNPHFHQ